MLYLPHLVGLLVTALVSFAVAWWVREQTHDRAGTVMIVLLVGHGAMALLTFVQVFGSAADWQVFWYRLWYPIGLLASPVVWFLLAVYYTGHERWLTKPVWAIVLASPIVPIVAWFTNPYHELLVADWVVETEPFVRVVPQHTGTNYLLVTLLNLYVIVAIGLFLRLYLFPRRRSRWQPGAVLLGMLAVFGTGMVTDTSLVPAPGFPYGHYGSGIFGALVAIVLFRTRFFGVTPLAHETIFEAIDDAIVVVDARRTITDFNETAVGLFPDLEHRVGGALDDVYPALVATDDSCCDGGGATAIVEQLDGTLDAPFAGAVRVSTAGDSRTLQISVSEISSGGEPRGYALIMRDVTELERYATELERKTDQLEQFASVLSHDLRNPVAVAIGYAQQAQATDDVDHVDDVLEALDRIDDTIENLLTLSREGQSIDELEVVDLQSVVADAWATSDTGAATLETDLDDRYPIRVDPSRLRTVLENLFRNAVDHGGETVRVGPLETGFYVADDGPGIPEDERDRIFEYGYSTSSNGTGLGLAIVASIVDGHEWSLSVTDGDEGGARFEVRDVEPIEETERSSVEPDIGSSNTSI